MSMASREVGSSILIGVIIVLTWKAIDFFSPILTEFVVDVWEESPEYAPDLIGFLLVIIILLLTIVVYLIRFGDDDEEE